MACYYSSIKGHHIIGYCHRCNNTINDDYPYWSANLDDILCQYYGKQKLVYCSSGCLEKQMEFVLNQLKQKGDNNEG